MCRLVVAMERLLVLSSPLSGMVTLMKWTEQISILKSNNFSGKKWVLPTAGSRTLDLQGAVRLTALSNHWVMGDLQCRPLGPGALYANFHAMQRRNDKELICDGLKFQDGRRLNIGHLRVFNSPFEGLEVGSTCRMVCFKWYPVQLC